MSGLIIQAAEKRGRYLPIKHNKLKNRDIVLIKDPYIKPYNFPLGKIIKTFINSKGETTHVEVFKGNTKEVTKRHVSCLIPLIYNEIQDEGSDIMNSADLSNYSRNSNTQRKAAISAKAKIKELLA